MTQSCGINSWFTNSAVAHAVATSPFGPFVKAAGEEAATFPPFATNPTLARGPKDEAVLVMGMATANGSAPSGPSRECMNCTDGSTPRTCKAERPGFWTNMAVAAAGAIITPTTPVFNILGHRSWGFNFALVSAPNATRFRCA